MPERYLLAGPGAITSVDNGDGARAWTLEAENIRELCLSLGMRWREYSAETPSGTRLRLLAADRRGAQAALETALEALEAYENWFGPLAWDVTIAQSDYALGTLSLPGLIWRARTRSWTPWPCAARWPSSSSATAPIPCPRRTPGLSDSVRRLRRLPRIEGGGGGERFPPNILNGEILPEAQYTLPGGVEVTSSAAILTAGEYESLILGRGALVMHEMRTAMGEETFLSALRLFYERWP